MVGANIGRTPVFEYAVEISRVVDGDTVDVDIDLGFGTWLMGERVRLYGINAPETRTLDLVEKEAGKATTVWLIERFAEASQITLKSVGFNGKFGRVLGVLKVDGVNVNAEMIRLGLAEENYYGNRSAGDVSEI